MSVGSDTLVLQANLFSRRVGCRWPGQAQGTNCTRQRLAEDRSRVEGSVARDSSFILYSGHPAEIGCIDDVENFALRDIWNGCDGRRGRGSAKGRGVAPREFAP